jgi:hypothetical protein
MGRPSPGRFPRRCAVRWPRRALIRSRSCSRSPARLGVAPAVEGQGAASCRCSRSSSRRRDVGLAVAPVEAGSPRGTRWPRSADSFFIIYRSPLEYAVRRRPRVIHQGSSASRPGTHRSTIEMEVGAHVAVRRPRRAWTYRIGTAAEWIDDEAGAIPSDLAAAQRRCPVGPRWPQPPPRARGRGRAVVRRPLQRLAGGRHRRDPTFDVDSCRYSARAAPLIGDSGT